MQVMKPGAQVALRAEAAASNRVPGASFLGALQPGLPVIRVRCKFLAAVIGAAAPLAAHRLPGLNFDGRKLRSQYRHRPSTIPAVAKLDEALFRPK